MADAMLEVDRRQVLAYRVAAHQLDRAGDDPAHLAVFDLGVPDTPYARRGWRSRPGLRIRIQLPTAR
jgi:hypothetical protein